MPDSTPERALAAPRFDDVSDDGDTAHSATAAPPPDTPQFKRNDAISPIVIVAVVLFWILQSTLFSTASRALRPDAHSRAAAKTSVSEEIPNALAEGIPTIALEAKQSYLGRGDLYRSQNPAVLRSPKTRRLRPKSPLDQRRAALATAVSLLARYPDQPAIARSVILLRAETGDPNPLGLPSFAPKPPITPLATPKTRAITNTAMKPPLIVNPLAAYAPYPGESAGRAKLESSERSIMVDLFSSKKPLTCDAEAQIDRQIAGLPQMRWWGKLAMHQAALRAGDKLGAAKALAQIKMEAASASTGASLVTLFEVAALLTGVGALIFLAKRWSEAEQFPRAANEYHSIFAERAPLIPDDQRRLGAGDLANLFFLYLALMIGLDYAVAYVPGHAIHRALIRLPYAQQQTVAILLEIALVALCGILTLAAMLWLAKKRGASLAREIGLNLGGRSMWRTALFGFIGWSISLPLSFLVGLIGKLIFHGAPDPANPVIPIIIAAPTGLPMLLLYVLTAFLAPFFEETMFRGLFFNAARLRVGTTGAILLTGAAFGLSHDVGIAQQCVLATLGAVLAWMAYTKKSLLPGMFAHFYQNTLVFGNLAFSLMLVTRPH